LVSVLFGAWLEYMTHFWSYIETKIINFLGKYL
jgi:hypothetical protein